MYHVIPIEVPLKRKDIRQQKIRRHVIPTEVRIQTIYRHLSYEWCCRAECHRHKSGILGCGAR